MFPASFFPSSYFTQSYWPGGSALQPLTAIITVDEGRGVTTPIYDFSTVLLHALDTVGATNSTGQDIQDNSPLHNLAHGCLFEWEQIGGPVTIDKGVRGDLTPMQWRGPILAVHLEDPGVYTFRLTVTDPDGQTASVDQNITVTDVTTQGDYQLYTLDTGQALGGNNFHDIVSVFNQLMSDSDGAGGQLAREVHIASGHSELVTGAMTTEPGAGVRNNFDKLIIRGEPGFSVKPLLNKNSGTLFDIVGTSNVSVVDFRFGGAGLGVGMLLRHQHSTLTAPTDFVRLRIDDEVSSWSGEAIAFSHSVIGPPTFVAIEDGFWDYTAPALTGAPLPGRSKFRRHTLKDCSSVCGTGIRYGFWGYVGFGGLFEGNSIVGSVDQHCLRLVEKQWCTVRGNLIRNTDPNKTALKSNDEHTGAPFAGWDGTRPFPDGTVGHPHQHLIVHDNTFEGAVGIAGQQNEWENSGEVEHIYIERNTFLPGSGGFGGNVDCGGLYQTWRNNLYVSDGGLGVSRSLKHNRAVTNFTISAEIYNETMLYAATAPAGTMRFLGLSITDSLQTPGSEFPGDYVAAEWDWVRVRGCVVVSESTDGQFDGFAGTIQIGSGEQQFWTDIEADLNTVHGLTGTPVGDAPPFASTEAASRGLTGLPDVGWIDRYGNNVGSTTDDADLVDITGGDYGPTFTTPEDVRPAGLHEDFYYTRRTGANTTRGAIVYVAVGPEVEPGSLILTGQNVELLGAAVVEVTPGALELVGQDVELDLSARLEVTPGTLELAGQDVELAGVSGQLEVTPGTLELAGQEIDLDSFQLLEVTPGTLELDGQDVELRQVGAPFLILPGELQFVGQEVTLTVQGGVVSLPVDAGFLILTGADVQLKTSEPQYIPCWAGEFAVSVIDVWNYALTRLGRETVSSTLEQTPDAARCRLVWPMVRRGLIEGMPMVGTKTTVQLNQLPVAPLARWDFRYAMPYNCIRPLNLNGRRLMADSAAWYEIEVRDDGLANELLTDEKPPAMLEYLRDQCNMDLLGPKTVKAMGLVLAHDLAPAFGKDEASISRMERNAERAVAQMGNVESIKHTPYRIADGDLLDART